MNRAATASLLISVLLRPIKTPERTFGKPFFGESEAREGERPREP
jgi:hypothetical protein